MLTITIDEKSINAISAAQLDIEPLWSNLELPASTDFSKCVISDDHGYILSRFFQPTDALLTISLHDDGPISNLSADVREEALGRLIRCTTRIITGRSRSIPTKWRPFHSKSLLSFQADRYFRSLDGGKTNAGRIILEHTHTQGPRVFAFLLDRDGILELGNVKPPHEIHNSALGGLTKAIAAPEEKLNRDSIGNALTLDNDLPIKTKGYYTTDDWYSTRLTTQQRRFVDHPLKSSVRLVGPAGTGKTVALIVKCIREVKKSIAEGTNKRFLFLTHAYDSAVAIEEMIEIMEPEIGIELLASDIPRIVATTLYALADQKMRYDLDGLSSISIDGHEGKNEQAEELNKTIEEYKSGNWIAFKSACSTPFITYMESPPESMERRFFLWEILNEFACVLDAEGVRSSTSRRDQYLNEKRKNWMMHLSSKEEREVILNLYDGFRKKLKDRKLIGGDQMITDYLNHLDSFRWEATREREGFDAIFVDELHLFNRQERMVFRNILKSTDSDPSVFMAYDAKQSPRDTFLKLPSIEAKQFDLWRDAKLGKVEKIELIDVFRYTPQIARALTRIDEAFPGHNLDDDWPQYTGVSQIGDGPVPTICEMVSTNATYSIVFKRARNLQKELGKNGRVAVLCASNELFIKYLDFSGLRDQFSAITSRDDASGIPRSTRKFIFSMPEYVAGLQFDTVLLIDVNRNEVPEGPYASAALRKFISQVYLGASRAERVLEFYASADQGGTSSTVTAAVLSGAIKLIKQEDIS